MDKELFNGDEKDAQNKSENTKNKTEVEKELQNEELDFSNENQMLYVEFQPESKRIRRESENYPDFKLEIDKDEGLHQKAIQVTSETSSSHTTVIEHQASDKLDYILGKKNEHVTKAVLKFPGTARKRITKKIKFINREDKIKNTITYQSKSPQILTKNERLISKMDRSIKCIEISNEKDISHAQHQDFEDPKSEVINIEKTKTGKPKIAKIKQFAIYNFESQSEDLSKDATPISCPVQCPPTPPCETKMPFESSNVVSAEEVLAHFRWFMQSNKDLSDLTIPNDNQNQNMKVVSEPGIQESKYYTETASASANQDLKEPTTDVLEHIISQESGKGTNEEFDILTEARIKTARYSPKKRIIYNERIEYIRWWVIQQIKDKEIMLKFSIMEGKYSNDIETKLKCIERAKYIQAEIDVHFDALDDQEKLLNIPKRMRIGPISVEKKSPKSTTKNEKEVKRPESRITTFTSLFLHLFKFSQSESENKNVFDLIDPIKFISAYRAYLECKERRDREGQMSEQTAKGIVGMYYQTLLQCHSRIKCKIPHPESRSVDDYQNYINDLRTAIDENLECLYSLFPPATSVILPLMSYLAHSRKKIVDIFAFLDQKQPKVFPEVFYKHQKYITETKQYSSSSYVPYKMEGKLADNSPVSPSGRRPFGPVLEENKQRAEQITDFLPPKTFDAKRDNSKQSPPRKENDVFLQSSLGIKKKNVKSSSIPVPSPFKGFTPDLLKLPLTKQKLAESISLVDACGFFKYFIRLKRTDLRAIEQQLDNISVELQKAIRDAKSICMKLENIPKNLPLDINALVVLAEKLMYLLSSSFRIFEKLNHCGSALKKDLQEYSKDALDFHVSTDILLEYILQGIIKECWDIEKYHLLDNSGMTFSCIF